MLVPSKIALDFRKRRYYSKHQKIHSYTGRLKGEPLRGTTDVITHLEGDLYGKLRGNK